MTWSYLNHLMDDWREAKRDCADHALLLKNGDYYLSLYEDAERIAGALGTHWLSSLRWHHDVPCVELPADRFQNLQMRLCRAGVEYCVKVRGEVPFTLSTKPAPPPQPAPLPPPVETQRLLLVDMKDLPGQTSFFTLNGKADE